VKERSEMNFWAMRRMERAMTQFESGVVKNCLKWTVYRVAVVVDHHG